MSGRRELCENWSSDSHTWHEYIYISSVPFSWPIEVEFCIEDLHIMLFHEIGYSEYHTSHNSINESLPCLIWILHLIWNKVLYSTTPHKWLNKCVSWKPVYWKTYLTECHQRNIAHMFYIFSLIWIKFIIGYVHKNLVAYDVLTTWPSPSNICNLNHLINFHRTLCEHCTTQIIPPLRLFWRRVVQFCNRCVKIFKIAHVWSKLHIYCSVWWWYNVIVIHMARSMVRDDTYFCWRYCVMWCCTIKSLFKIRYTET